MALHRGIQSAIFYYLSCAPCTGYSGRQKRKKQAQRDRADREALEGEQPGLYKHPSPFATNPHWEREIVLGPGPPQRKSKKANFSESQRGLKTAGTQSSAGSNVPSSVDLRPASRDERQDSKWNFKPYQREDEELWGSTSTERFTDGSVSMANLGHSFARPPTARTNKSTSSTYYAPRNPAINDLHPPVVTKVGSREDVMWMMQPPPVAEVMSGKERVQRSRSNSHSSAPSRKEGSVKLSRQVSGRIIERRMMDNENLDAPAISRESLHQIATGPRGQRHDTSSLRLDDEWSSTESLRRKRSRKRPAPLQVSEISAHSTATVIHRDPLVPGLEDGVDDMAKTRKVASRPRLSTIVSDSNTAEDTNNLHVPLQVPNGITSRRNSSDLSTERDTYRPPLITSGSSLKVLQELAPVATVLNAKLLTSPPPIKEPIAKLPHPDPSEERSLHDSPTKDPWYTLEDVDVPTWIEGHVRREVRQRWSMDF